MILVRYSKDEMDWKLLTDEEFASARAGWSSSKDVFVSRLNTYIPKPSYLPAGPPSGSENLNLVFFKEPNGNLNLCGIHKSTGVLYEIVCIPDDQKKYTWSFFPWSSGGEVPNPEAVRKNLEAGILIPADEVLKEKGAGFFRLPGQLAR